MQAVKIAIPVYFLANLTPVHLSLHGVNRSLDMQGLCNRGACVIKS